MTRISTIGSDLYNLAQIMQTRQSMDSLQYQVSSGKKSQDYAGISDVSGQLVNLDDEHDSINNYISANTIVNTQMDTQQTAYSSLQDTMTQFQQQLGNAIENNISSPQDLHNLQIFAFQSLKNMEFYLNTSVSGQYIFSGSKTDTPPVNMPYSDLDQFQGAYDGYSVAYPTTHDADIGSTTTQVKNTGSLTFDDAKGTISAANKGQFANIAVGSTIAVSGSQSHSGRYTVLANDGTTLTLSHNLTTEGTTLSPSSVSITRSDQTSLQTQVTFSQPDTITATTPGAFTNLPAGSAFTVAGATNAANNGNFIVASNDGTHIVIKRADFTGTANLTTNAADAGALITSDGLTYGAPGGANVATGNLQFTAPNTIAASVANSLQNVPVGSVISVGGATPSANNGSYVVTSNNGTTITVSSANPQTSLTDESANASATLSDTTTGAALTPGSLAFYSGTSIVLAGSAGSLNGVQAGQSINVSGSASNNGSFKVTGTFSTPIVTEAANANAQISNGSGTVFSTASLAFNAGTNQITAAAAGDLNGIKPGDVVHVTGSSSNNGAFVVTAIDNPAPATKVLTVAPANTAVQVAKDISISTVSYYQGDTKTTSQQVDKNMALSHGVTAIDPAFDKAIRAMALIAQGALGTAGGLDMNKGRIEQANYLITSAINNTASGTPPFGTEQSSNVEELSMTLGYQQKMMSDLKTQQQSYLNFVDTARGNMLNADQTTTVTELLHQQTALQASYQAMATMRQLSLVNYMK